MKEHKLADRCRQLSRDRRAHGVLLGGDLAGEVPLLIRHKGPSQHGAAHEHREEAIELSPNIVAGILVGLRGTLGQVDARAEHRPHARASEVQREGLSENCDSRRGVRAVQKESLASCQLAHVHMARTRRGSAWFWFKHRPRERDTDRGRQRTRDRLRNQTLCGRNLSEREGGGRVEVRARNKCGGDRVASVPWSTSGVGWGLRIASIRRSTQRLRKPGKISVQHVVHVVSFLSKRWTRLQGQQSGNAATTPGERRHMPSLQEAQSRCSQLYSEGKGENRRSTKTVASTRDEDFDAGPQDAARTGTGKLLICDRPVWRSQCRAFRMQEVMVRRDQHVGRCESGAAPVWMNRAVVDATTVLLRSGEHREIQEGTLEPRLS